MGSQRRFLTAADIDAGDRELFYGLEIILRLIIMAEFASLIDTLDPIFSIHRLTDIDGNNILIEGQFNAVNIRVVPNQVTDISPFILDYYRLLPTAIVAIRQAMTPVVRDEYLRQVGLSPQQFLITLVDFEIEPSVTFEFDPLFHRRNPSYWGYLNGGIIFKVKLRVEDISILEPGEIGALQAKYNYLCRDKSLTSTRELYQWAESINLPLLPREELCQAIADYYDF